IQNDTIWVRDDTQTHKAGDFVDVKQAAVLKKLGITPIESLIKIDYAWSNGEIISEEILYMDMDKFKQDFSIAYREALGILFEMPFFSEDMTDEYIRKGASEANLLNLIIFGEGVKAVIPVEIKVEEKEPEEEEEEEEVGIGGLFG
ncbi:unnamed protein product, partial [marine sediment metagenome]